MTYCDYDVEVNLELERLVEHKNIRSIMQLLAIVLLVITLFVPKQFAFWWQHSADLFVTYRTCVNGTIPKWWNTRCSKFVRNKRMFVSEKII